MSTLLAFDVYGTLIDTQGVIEALRRRIGERAPAFSALWRDKQLEYAFRRGLMRRYRTFADCTAQALDYCCAAFAVDFSEADKAALLAGYARLPAFPDVAPGLAALAARGARMVAFSNGTAAAVEGLLQHAGIARHFETVVSVDEIATFKPNPDIYQHLLQRCGCAAAASWLISSNPFDVIGARAVGMEAAWVRRSSSALFDPWEWQPSAVVGDLSGLAELLD